MQFFSSKIMKILFFGFCLCICEPVYAGEYSPENVQVLVGTPLTNQDKVINQETQNDLQANQAGSGNEVQNSDSKPNIKPKAKDHLSQTEETKGRGTTNNSSDTLLDTDHPGPDTERGSTHNGSNFLLNSR